ncbi:glycosyltransferase [Geomonas subterranea]|uniref:Glycosyltransferase n=1 Tax=Geomonas subterranea TaxID=2847989 RepID=A0ABX8LJM3_9BACT|nr:MULTISPECIES: glycosyltransferase [Geomonas]QXE90910.1 glycosyltransferase [Geomonas subterranea]QXM11004.1 glycosyltransferase [Geomonas subterranea]
MNVCLISQEYPPETNWGGIATYTQVLARQLAATGHRVHVISLADAEEYSKDDMGVTVHRVSRTPHSPIDLDAVPEVADLSHWTLSFSQRVYEKVLELHLAEPFEVIEAPETCAQALIVFKLLDGPAKVTRLHTPFFWVRHLNDMPEAPEHLVRDELEKLQTELSTAVTSPTHAMAEVVRQKWGTPDIAVIPNFFNLKVYTPDTSIYDQLLTGKEYLLFFGRLEYRKGAHLLAQALPKVLDAAPGLVAVLIGSDSIHNSVSMKQKLLAALAGYEERIVFIENIPHESLYPIIERSKFVVLPSLWENFPYACIEAMALGKTVVTSDSGGFPEIIDDGQEGILCPPNDSLQLQKAMLQCLAGTDLASIGAKAKEKVRVFDTAKVTARMLEFYAGLTTRGAGSTGLKVAYILRHIPVPSETFVINEIIAMQQEGLEVYPVSILPAQKCHETLMAKLNHEVYDIAQPEAHAHREDLLAAAQGVAAEAGIAPVLALQAALTAAHVLGNGIDHIHAHFATESALVAFITSRITGVPFSFTAHAYDIFMRDRKVIDEESPVQRLTLLTEAASKVVTISEYNKSYILGLIGERYRNKIEIVRCGIDPARFTFLERGDRGKVTFLSIGRFVEKKGHDYLLRAFAEVRRVVPESELRLLGDGYHRPAMMELAAQLGVADSVYFGGSVSSEVVIAEMERADVFVLHSVTGANGDREGIPVSIMEACATGLPVISTRHSGIPELVLDGVTGLLSDERDVAAFANHMIALCFAAPLRQRFGAAGKEVVLGKFNQGAEARKLAALLRSLAAPAAAGAGAKAADVDIIMPTYRPNLAFLKSAVESIRNQTFRNWKLYLVQDGEDVDLQPFVDSFNDGRIHYRAVPHQGKPAALNFAISCGTGKYIAYLDDDDVWYPNHLETMISHMEQTGKQFVHTDAHEVEVRIEEDRLVKLSSKPLNKGVLTDKTMWYISHINSAHSRSLLAKAGRYDEEKSFFIDWDMLQRLAALERPTHLKVATCEHYNYQNRQTKNISLVHKEDPGISAQKHKEMFKRAFTLLSADDFVEVVEEHQSLLWHLDQLKLKLAAAEREQANLAGSAALDGECCNELKAKLVEMEQKYCDLNKLVEDKERHIEALYDSLSWKVTAPLRWAYDMVRGK